MVAATVLIFLGITFGVAAQTPAAAASSAQPSEGAQVDSAAIDKAIAGLDYEEAREMLLIALAQEGLSDEQRLELHMKAGMVDRVLNQNVEAKMHFQEALLLNPEASLPAGEAPKIQTFFDLVKGDFKRGQGRAAAPPPAESAQPAPAPVAAAAEETGAPWTAFGVVGLGAAVAIVLSPALLAASTASYFLLVANGEADAGTRNAGRTAWVGLAGASAIAVVAGAAVATVGAVMVAYAE